MSLACSLSGITSIMFCGIAMAKYCRPNLSSQTDERVGAFFRVIAYIAEIFVFIYIGLALFTDERARKIGATWTFMLGSLAALALSRVVNIYPITGLCNYLTPAEGRKIPQTHKHMLWFSGLRGAMAFALANLARDELAGKPHSEAGDVILTATFFMVCASLVRTCLQCLPRTLLHTKCHDDAHWVVALCCKHVQLATGAALCFEFPFPCTLGVQLHSLAAQVLITVLINGGGTYYLLKHWHLQEGDPAASEGRELAPMLNARGSGDNGAFASDEAHPIGSPPVSCSTWGSNNVTARYTIYA